MAELFDKSIRVPASPAGAARSDTEARMLAATLLEASTEYSLIVTDPDGVILAWNEGAHRLYGYDASEIVGRPKSLLHTEADVRRGLPQAMMKEALERGKWEGLVERVRKDGSRFIARMILTPRTDEEGKAAGFLLLSLDSTHEVTVSEALERSQAYTRAVVESAPDAIVIVNHDGEIQLANAATETLFGYRRDELIGQAVGILVPDHYRARHPAQSAGFFANPRPRPMGSGLDLLAKRKDGAEFPVEISLSSFETEDGMLAIAAIRDVTERKRLKQDIDELETLQAELRQAQRDTAEALTLLETVQSTAPIGFGFIDREFRVRHVNPMLASMHGLSVDRYLGLTVAEGAPEFWPQLEPLFRRVLDTGEAVLNLDAQAEVPSAPGEIRQLLASYYPVRLGGEVIGIGIIVVDVTESVQAADFRGVVMETMAEGLTVTDADGRLVLMNAAAARMTGWTEDELRGKVVHDVLHYQHEDGSVFPAEECPMMRILEDGRTLRIAEDAFTRKDGTIFPIAYSATPLFNNTAVRGVAVVFRDTTDERAERTRAQRELNQLTWVGRIREALDDDRLVLYTQPIVPLTEDSTPSEELLIRMVGRKGEIIPPGSFLPVAEKFGQIAEIDRWVIGQAAKLAASGRHVHANLSAASIADLDLLQVIARELSSAGADPANLVFEITETALMVDVDAGEAFTRGLAEIGCPIALDDFGTGYGSFTYLQKLRLGYLKIDIAFVRDLVSNPANQHLVKATVNIAQGFGLQTIAEGVEDGETLDLLRDYGVDLAQGFHLGRPQPLNEA